MNIIIRAERPADIAAIHAINTAAFETTLEAQLVDALRAAASPLISLVAEEENAAIVGHILFSPVTIETPDDAHAGLVLGLAPMAVAPARQRHGIGSALVHEGIAACRRAGAIGLVVLGHPTYYPRFGFTPASRFGLSCEYDAPDEAFMAMELAPNAFAQRSGRVRYHSAFALVG